MLVVALIAKMKGLFCLFSWMSFCYLYLNATYKFQNHGEQFLRFSYLYLTVAIHREQFPRNPELFLDYVLRNYKG